LVPFGDHELTGFVDHIEIKKAGNGHRTLRIVDFKTNSKQPNMQALRLDIQFTVYVYAAMQPEFWMGNGPDFPPLPDGEAMYEIAQRLPVKAIWHHLWTGKEIYAGDRDDGDFMRLYRLATEIQKAMDADIFVPNIGEACIWCDYTEPCGIKVPTYEEAQRDMVS
jgi:RecB family exonuclease